MLSATCDALHRGWRSARLGVLAVAATASFGLPAMADSLTLPTLPGNTVVGIALHAIGAYDPAGALTVTGLPGTGYFETVTGQAFAILNPPANDVPTLFGLDAQAAYQYNSDPVQVVLPETQLSLNDLLGIGAITFADLATGIEQILATVIPDLITSFENTYGTLACDATTLPGNCTLNGSPLLDFTFTGPTGDLATGVTLGFAVGIVQSFQGGDFGPILFRGDAGTIEIAGSAAIYVPEPASATLFGLGLLGLGMIRRRRDQA